MNRLGIEFLSVFGLPPVEFVHLAADLGCANISTGLTPIPYNPFGFNSWSLRDDPQLRRDMVAAMEERQVTISLGEGFAIREGSSVERLAADLEIMRELGVTRINTVAMDPSMERCVDQMGDLVYMAESLGMETTLEFAPGMTIADLNAAVQTIIAIDRPSFRLLLDTMHVFRSGAGVDDLCQLRPEWIGYVQINDVPLLAPHPNYMNEAMFERLIPGAGDLPLRDFLSAMPSDTVISIEVPNRQQAESNASPYPWIKDSVVATQTLLKAIARI